MSETPYYKNTKDAMAEVGITPRQLAYWRKEGLFTPQLGDNKRYTELDIKLPKFLKKLVDPKDGYGLPVETIRRLLFTLAPPSHPLYWSRPRFIDLERDCLTTADRIAREHLVDEAHRFLGFDNDAFYRIALLIFQEIAYSEPSPKVYVVKRDDFLEQLQRTDLMARLVSTPRELTSAEWTRYTNNDEEPPEFITEYSFSPSLSSDPQLTYEELERLSLDRKRIMGY